MENLITEMKLQLNMPQTTKIEKYIKIQTLKRIFEKGEKQGFKFTDLCAAHMDLV